MTSLRSSRSYVTRVTPFFRLASPRLASPPHGALALRIFRFDARADPGRGEVRSSECLCLTAAAVLFLLLDSSTFLHTPLFAFFCVK